MTQAAPAEVPGAAAHQGVDRGPRHAHVRSGVRAGVASCRRGGVRGPARRRRASARRRRRGMTRPAREGPSPETRTRRTRGKKRRSAATSRRGWTRARARARRRKPPAATKPLARTTRTPSRPAAARAPRARARVRFCSRRTPRRTGVDRKRGRGRGGEELRSRERPAGAARARAAKTPVTKTPVAVATRATRSKTPAAAEKTPKKTSSGTAKRTLRLRRNLFEETSSARGAEASGSGPRGASSSPAAARRPRVALSGFGSADLTKYGATATRPGASLCAGHAWDPARRTLRAWGPAPPLDQVPRRGGFPACPC